MRMLILAATSAVILGACQPAAEPQPVEAQAAPEVTAVAPVDAGPAIAQEPASPPARTPSAAGPARPAPAPAPAPEPADPMADHDMSQMDGMTMPPKQ